MTAPLIAQTWLGSPRCPELSMAQWERLLGQARCTALLARLAQHGLEQGWLEQVPTGPRQYLDGALHLAARQRQAVRWEAHCVQRALAALDVPVVLLKGAAYVMAELPPARARLFSDIDIMVPRERLADVETALFAAGWLSAERDAYNQRYYRTWMHEIPPLKHVQRQTVLDVHHAISPLTSRFKVDSKPLFAQLRPVAGLFVLAPTDMVLHSAVHLFQEGEFGHGLRDLLDLQELIAHFSAQEPLFWHALLERATELGVQIPLTHALGQLARWFGTMAPPECRQEPAAPRTSAAAQTAMSSLFGAAMQPQHPSCANPWSTLARWLLYVRSHYIRMPVHLIVPHLLRKAYMHHFPATPTP